MRLLAATLFSIALVFQFGGCARQTATQAPVQSNAGRTTPTGSGFKSPGQVAPCCKAMAEGRIGIEQCMENPACIANNRTCCMQAIQ